MHSSLYVFLAALERGVGLTGTTGGCKHRCLSPKPTPKHVIDVPIHKRISC